MNGRYLLDTNIVIALFAADDAVQTQLRAASAVYLPTVVLGELYYGVRKSTQVESNLQRLEEFADQSALVECNRTTAREYGIIKNDLRAKGLPIPENDIWIAAIARQHQLTLVSRDDHFAAVEGLSVQTW